jgi:hypothetical protein
MGNNVSYRKEFGLMIMGALIFAASFLWKDLFVEIEEIYFPKKYGMTGRVIYTIIITAIIFLVVIYIKDKYGLVNSDAAHPKIDEELIHTNDHDHSYTDDMYSGIDL